MKNLLPMLRKKHIFFASHAAWESQFAIFDTPLRWLCSKKSRCLAAEGLQNSKMCFPCSLRSPFFNASHVAWESHFWNRLDPYGINDVFSWGVNSSVAAVGITVLLGNANCHCHCGHRHFLTCWFLMAKAWTQRPSFISTNSRSTDPVGKYW